MSVKPALNHVDVIFDSSAADSYKSGGGDYPRFTLFPSLDNVVGFAVVKVSLPFSYYAVDGTNNQFSLNIQTITGTLVTGTGGSVAAGTTVATGTYICTLVNGTYTSTTIVAAFLAALERSYIAAAPATTYDISSLFTLGVYPNSNLLYIFATGATNYVTTWQLLFPTTSTLNKIFGFTTNSQYYAASAYTAVAATATVPFHDNAGNDYMAKFAYLIGDTSASLQGEPYLFLHSSLSSSLEFGSVRTHVGGGDKIAHIEVNNNFPGTIDYTVQAPQMQAFSESIIPELSFYLTLGNRTTFESVTGTSTNYLSLNGQPFYIIIRFYCYSGSVNQKYFDADGNKATMMQGTSGSARAPFGTQFKVADHRGSKRLKIL